MAVSIDSTSLSSVDMIPSFSRRSVTLLEDSGVAALLKNADRTATPVLTPLQLMTLFSVQIEDIVSSSTADDMMGRLTLQDRKMQDWTS